MKLRHRWVIKIVFGTLLVFAGIRLSVSQSEGFGVYYDNNRGLIGDVLRAQHLSGSLVRSGTCRSHYSKIAIPLTVHPPRFSGPTVDVLRDMFAGYDHMRVTQDSTGMIRMVEDGVPTDILNVKIHHLSFDQSSGDSSELENLTLRGPNTAWPTILLAPEVRKFKMDRNIGPDGFPLPGNAFNQGLPIISGQLDNVTVSQALDYILKSAPGYWVYENCTTENGRREVLFWFY